MARSKSKDGRITRREFIQGAAAVTAGAAIATRAKARDDDRDDDDRGRRRGPGDHEEAELVLEHGKIHTMDPRKPIVSSVAIADGRFIGVGREVKRGPHCKTIDLRGRTVVPGIIDNHNHIVLMGNRPGYHTPLENAYSIADVQKIYADRAAQAPQGAWITTIGGFSPNHIYATPGNLRSGRLPTLAELDAAVPNNPVFIEVGFTGPAVTNSLGKQAFQNQTLVPTITVADDGSMIGQNPSRALLFLRQTLLSEAERERSVLDAMNYALTVGVTTHQDQGAFQATGTPSDGSAHEDNYTMHIPFLKVYDQGKGVVRLRINFLHMETNPDTPELVQRLKNAFQFLGNDWVKTGSIGEFIAAGTNDSTPFRAAALKVAAAHWRAEVHSLGRRTTAAPKADWEFELDGFEAANAQAGSTGIVREMRWVIAHVPGITKDGIERMQKLGGGLSLTGWQYLAGNLPNPATGTDALYAGPPFRMIVDNSYLPDGVHAGMSSDGMQIAPMNPWLHMYYATTGINTKGALINPNQQISRQEVLELYTSRNGWFLREEDQLGSIEEGKLADLVVLDRDYFTVSNEDLKKIRSVLTVVGGNVFYHADGVLDTRG
jgi:hypothetical protein